MDFGLAAVEGRPRSYPSLPWPVAWASTAASREAVPTAHVHSERSTPCYVPNPQFGLVESSTGLAAPGYTRPDGPDASFGQLCGQLGTLMHGSVGETGRGVRTGMVPAPINRSGAGRLAKLDDKED